MSWWFFCVISCLKESSPKRPPATRVYLVCLYSEWRGGSVRDRGTLHSSRRGGRLLQQIVEGASSLGDLLRPDGDLCRGPHHPAARAAAALQVQRPLWGDHRRVLAGAASHQVTERERTSEHIERTQPIHSCGGQSALTFNAQPQPELRLLSAAWPWMKMDRSSPSEGKFHQNTSDNSC